MSQVEAVSVRFTGDTRDLDEATKRSEGRLRRLSDTAAKVGKRMASMGAAASVAAGGLAFAAGRAVNFADAIGKSAQAASVTTSQIQELRFAFGQLAGTTDRDVDMALQRFNRRLGLARDGAKEYQDQFAALNVTLRQDTPAALEETLIKLAEIENDSDRAARASRIFGEEAGPRLAAALSGGIEAVEQLREQLVADGGVISEDLIRRSESFNDQMDRLSKTVTAEMASSILENADALGSLAESFGSVASKAIDALGALSSFGSSVGRTLAVLSGFDPGTGLAPNAPRPETPTASPERRPKLVVASGSGGGLSRVDAPDVERRQAPFGSLDDMRAQFDDMAEASERRLELLQDRYASEEELLAENKARELEIVRESMERLQVTEEEGRALIEQIEQGHMDSLAAIRERGMSDLDRITQQSFDRQASYVASSLAEMTASAATQNKTMFQINKAAALASAALDAREAVTGSYKVGARIGGPPLGAAFAAASAAAQAANIAAIASTSYGSNTAPSVGATAAPAVQPVNGQGQPAGEGGGGPSQTLTVQGISGDALFDGGSVRALAEKLLEFQRDGGRVILQG